MCVIFACYENYPSDLLLKRGAERNKDGAGVAWVDKKNKTVRWKKGLPSDPEKVKAILSDQELIPSFPVLIHFRSASVGEPIPPLTHPFPVTHGVGLSLEGNAKMVLMHNGTWGDWRHILKTFCITHKIRLPDGPWSDSRAYAFMAAYLGSSILPILDLTDRLIVLDGDSRWTYWGDWKDAETQGENGFLMSSPLLGPINNQRSHKSGYDTSSGRGAYWDSATGTFRETPSDSRKGGESEKKAGQAAAKSSPPSGGDAGENSSPLVPAGDTKLLGPSKTSASPALPAPASPDTSPHVRIIRPPSSESNSLDELLGLKKGEPFTMGSLETIFFDVRRKNGLSTEHPGH